MPDGYIPSTSSTSSDASGNALEMKLAHVV